MQIDLSNVVEGTVSLRCKPGRVEGINEQVKAVVTKGEMRFKDALSIKGKLNFAESQMFCRLSGPLSRMLSQWTADGLPHPLTKAIRTTFSWTMERLLVAGPREISPPSDVAPIVIFTDGACEEEVSVGGIMFTREGRVEAFGAVLNKKIVEGFKVREEQSQVIGQAELLPVLVAKETWKETLRGRRALFFVDNEAARLGLVKGYSPVLPSLELILASSLFDFQHDCSSWYRSSPCWWRRVSLRISTTHEPHTCGNSRSGFRRCEGTDI